MRKYHLLFYTHIQMGNELNSYAEKLGFRIESFGISPGDAMDYFYCLISWEEEGNNESI